MDDKKTIDVKAIEQQAVRAGQAVVLKGKNLFTKVDAFMERLAVRIVEDWKRSEK